MKIFIDGKFCSERDAKVSVFDHGLLYGDGVFEGIRARRRVPGIMVSIRATRPPSRPRPRARHGLAAQ